jgi:ribose transport system substrate-binding protein
LNNGAQDKARELGGVTVTFSAPQVGKVDPAEQLRLIEDAITRRVDAIMLAPLHADALVPGIQKVKEAGIRLILVDSGANTEEYDAFFFTDNAAAARLAADEMAKVINGQGKVAIINAQAGAGTTMIREEEFKAQIASRYPGITIVGTQYSDGDAQRALNIATDFMTANPDLAGIYACNEGASVGTGNAIDQSNKAGIVRFVGFDFSDNLKSMIERGICDATMVQNPYQMGYLGVQAAVDLVQGRSVTRLVDTGVTVATKDNLTTIK